MYIFTIVTSARVWREREREFYLTPAEPGCGHMAAGAAELSLSPACRSIHEAFLCTDLRRAFCLCYNTKRIHLLELYRSSGLEFTGFCNVDQAI